MREDGPLYVGFVSNPSLCGRLYHSRSLSGGNPPPCQNCHHHSRPAAVVADGQTEGAWKSRRRHPRRPVIGPIPLRRPAVFAEIVADVLNTAQGREYVAAGAAVLGAKLAGEALSVAEAPVDN